MTDLTTDSLKATEAECAEGRTAPRVSLADIEANIMWEQSFVASEAARACPAEALSHLGVLTIYVLVLRNGFTIIGKAAPASPDNFNDELGAKLAREDAIRQCWPIMGYALRERLKSSD